MRYQNILKLTFLGACIFTISCSPKIKINEAFSHAQEQTELLLEELEKTSEKRDPEQVSPRTIDSYGELRVVESRDWTSGFFPGVLWYLYEYTGEDKWKEAARDLTADIEKEKWNAGTHDMGFKIYCSFGNGYRLTNDEEYRDVIVQSANTLIKRFNPNVGAIRSWDHNADKWDFPVIIDNMMNLELLFAASDITGDPSFYNIAVEHAKTTLRNHFREDNSSYHVISFDPETGEVEKRNTHQGYSHESSWSRGQAWGLYGFTMSYRVTQNKEFLEQAEKIADFILDHPNLPKDFVPYWDFDAPNIPNEERDVSAAAVTASALYELSTYSENGETYLEAADKVLESLTEKYISPVDGNKGFILDHSVGSRPSGSEVDVPLAYADYYYLEALLRKKKLKGGKLDL